MDAATTCETAYVVDPLRDRLIALARLVQWLEDRTRRRHHRSLVYRWVQRGMRAEDGTIIRLPTCRIGGVKYTSEEGFAWWCARLAGQPAAAAAARAAAVAGDAEDEATLRRAGVL